MNSSALLTDLYQLTMANGYFTLGLHNKQSCFHQFFRRTPFGSQYAITAGLESALEFLEDFSFSKSDIEYLSSLTSVSGAALFSKAFLEFLETLKLSCDIDAMLEGTAVFPHEPMLRVRGPLLQCQLLETALLNIINFQTLIATKAARCVSAACGREVIDFGLRRAQGPDGGLSGSRAAFIGGCQSTSNVLAGKRYGIPVKGTQAHSWIMAFGDEKTAFRAFAKAMPDNVILLVDTYHTATGIKNAIEVGQEMKSTGLKLLGIRLDSGNLSDLSKLARSMLDRAGLTDTKIVASGDLDEYKIKSLLDADSPIDVFGVGTRLITAFDEPALGGVYKLSATGNDDGTWKVCLKVSDDDEKTTLPGILQTRRFSKDNKMAGDLIFDDVDNKNPQFKPPEVENTTIEDLLVTVFKKGRRVLEVNSVQEAQARTRSALIALGESHTRLIDPQHYDVWVDPFLLEKQKGLKQKASS